MSFVTMAMSIGNTEENSKACLTSYSGYIQNMGLYTQDKWLNILASV